MNYLGQKQEKQECNYTVGNVVKSLWQQVFTVAGDTGISIISVLISWTHQGNSLTLVVSVLMLWPHRGSWLTLLAVLLTLSSEDVCARAGERIWNQKKRSSAELTVIWYNFKKSTVFVKDQGKNKQKWVTTQYRVLSIHNRVFFLGNKLKTTQNIPFC